MSKNIASVEKNKKNVLSKNASSLRRGIKLVPEWWTSIALGLRAWSWPANQWDRINAFIFNSRHSHQSKQELRREGINNSFIWLRCSHCQASWRLFAMNVFFGCFFFMFITVEVSEHINRRWLLLSWLFCCSVLHPSILLRVLIFNPSGGGAEIDVLEEAWPDSMLLSWCSANFANNWAQ